MPTDHYERIQDPVSNSSPITRIEVSNPSNSTNKFRDIKAILDTGAGRTFIPESIIEKLGLLNYTLIRVSSPLDKSILSRKCYLVRIEFGGKSHEVEVLDISKDYAVIGRDILNQYKIILDAPNKVWSIE